MNVMISHSYWSTWQGSQWDNSVHISLFNKQFIHNRAVHKSVSYLSHEDKNCQNS